MRLLLRVLYWAAVIAISVVLLVVLVRFFESRDESEVGSLVAGGVAAAPAYPPATRGGV